MINENKNHEPLDLSYLREMSGDSTDFMIEMLEAFLIQTPLYIDDLEKAVNARDWKATSESAHKMKPTFFYIGRVDVRDHMQEIETNARELRDVEIIPAAFNQVKEFVPVLYQQLADAKAELEKQL